MFIRLRFAPDISKATQFEKGKRPWPKKWAVRLAHRCRSCPARKRLGRQRAVAGLDFTRSAIRLTPAMPAEFDLKWQESAKIVVALKSYCCQGQPALPIRRRK
jgi:hypothetical protein